MGCSSGKGLPITKIDHLIEQIEVHKSGVTCLAISEDHSLLVTGTEDGVAIMWSALSQSSESIGKLVGHESTITCCLVHDRYVITGSMDSTIRQWSIESGMCLHTFKGHSSKINKVVCSSCFLLSTSYDKTAKAWLLCDSYETNEETNILLRTFNGHSKSVYPIVFVPTDNKPTHSTEIFERDRVITGSADCSIKIWSLVNGECLKTLCGHNSPIQCLEMEPLNMKHLFSAGGDGVIICWDIITGDLLRQLKGHNGAILCMASHKRFLYTGSVDRTARAWVMEFGECTRVFFGNSPISFVQYYNGLVCTASCDGIANLFDSKSGTMKRTFEGHTNSITGLQVVAGKMFTTCSDGKMCVWNITGMKEETVFGKKAPKEATKENDDCDAIKDAIRVVDYFVRH